MISLKQMGSTFLIFRDGVQVAAAELYDNPVHLQNAYVRLQLGELSPNDSAELFALLRRAAGRPLQVMTDSEDTVLVRFLTAGGFLCRRKCYEMEVSAGNYTGFRGHETLRWCAAGSPDYETCGKLLYAHYKTTHENVNPWTADFAAFLEDLPSDAVYLRENDEIVALSLVEGGELAYICGKDAPSLRRFAESLIPALFETHETLCFEWDDCDWAAMLLKGLFSAASGSSFDTYIYP